MSAELPDRPTGGASGDGPAGAHELGGVLERHRERLKRTVALRLDRRLARRVDPSDVIQDVFVEATRRYGEYEQNPSLPFFLWLRLLTLQQVALVHRKNLHVKARSAECEVALDSFRHAPAATSVALAEMMIGRLTTPSQAARRAELRQGVQQALEQLDPIDREVLALRHFEQLNNTEVAEILELSESAASKRYLRALVRVKEILAGPQEDTEP